ncbi:13023_t:CDS:2, partial [Racocetra persica]
FGVIRPLKMFNDQSFNDITGEDNMSFEYEGISNFENNLYENISDGNIIDDENVTDDEDSDHTEDEKNKTTRSLPITSYFTPCEVRYCDVYMYNDDGTSKKYTTVFMPKTSTTNIAAHLCTEHQIFKTQKWEVQPPLISTTIPTATNQRTIETVIQKHIENASPLPEKQQNRIAYRLVAWIVEEMMPLNCINHDR